MLLDQLRVIFVTTSFSKKTSNLSLSTNAHTHTSRRTRHLFTGLAERRYCARHLRVLLCPLLSHLSHLFTSFVPGRETLFAGRSLQLVRSELQRDVPMARVSMGVTGKPLYKEPGVLGLWFLVFETTLGWCWGSIDRHIWHTWSDWVWLGATGSKSLCCFDMASGTGEDFHRCLFQGAVRTFEVWAIKVGRPPKDALEERK